MQAEPLPGSEVVFERLLRYAPLGLFILTLSILATNLAPLWGCLGFRGSPKTCYMKCSVPSHFVNLPVLLVRVLTSDAYILTLKKEVKYLCYSISGQKET